LHRVTRRPRANDIDGFNDAWRGTVSPFPRASAILGVRKARVGGGEGGEGETARRFDSARDGTRNLYCGFVARHDAHRRRRPFARISRTSTILSSSGKARYKRVKNIGTRGRGGIRIAIIISDAMCECLFIRHRAISGDYLPSRVALMVSRWKQGGKVLESGCCARALARALIISLLFYI